MGQGREDMEARVAVDSQATAQQLDVEKADETEVEQAQRSPLSKWRTVALVVTVTGAAFTNTLSYQAAVIILPSIGRDLNIPTARQQWIISSYSLAFGCFLCLWGRLADVYGKKRIFVFGSGWVCIVTLICPFVPNEIAFDTFRGLQGLGAAANVPTAIGILGVTFPPGKTRTYAFAAFSAGAPMGSVFGNIFSGLVTEFVSWKWVFWIQAIIAATTTVASYYFIPLPIKQPSANEVKNAVDWIGGVLLTSSLFILLFALTEGNIAGWGTPYIISIIVVAVVLFTIFVLWQLYLEKKTTKPPLIKISLFARGRVAAALLVMALLFSSFNQYLVFATYFFQDYQGLSPLQTCIRFIPLGPSGIITIICVSQALRRFKANYIATFGMSCMIISSTIFAAPIPPSTSYWAWAFIGMCTCCMAVDSLFPSLIVFNAANLPIEDQALGGALINAVGQTSRSIGLAIAIAIQVAVQGNHQSSSHEAATGGGNLHNPAFLAGLRAGQWFSAALAMLGLFVVIVFWRGAGVLGKAK